MYASCQFSCLKMLTALNDLASTDSKQLFDVNMEHIDTGNFPGRVIPAVVSAIILSAANNPTFEVFHSTPRSAAMDQSYMPLTKAMKDTFIGPRFLLHLILVQLRQKQWKLSVCI